MKKTLLSAIMVFMILALAGCGNGGGGTIAPATIVTQILTDPVYDGDILRTSPTTSTVTQGMTPTVQSVFAGRDPANPPDEFRAFLDFPLSGPNGVPANAVIVSATLDIVINNVFPQLPGDTIPIRIDLVSFQPPTLLTSDFDLGIQPALASTTIVPSISSMDVNHHVFVDVTSLMVLAQNLVLPDFQVRILEDPGAPFPGLIEINDTTGAFRGALAPLLQVEYF
jgi:predicted small lipoprotein YifL